MKSILGSDAQPYFAVGLPCITVVASLVLNLFQISGLRKDIREIRAHLRTIVEKINAARLLA